MSENNSSNEGKPADEGQPSRPHSHLRDLIQKHNSQIQRAASTSKLVKRRVVSRGTLLSAIVQPQFDHKEYIAKIEQKRQLSALKQAQHEPATAAAGDIPEITVVEEDENDLPAAPIETLRGRIVYAIHSHAVQAALLLLLLVDVFVVIAELIIDAHKDCNLRTFPGNCSALSFANASGYFSPADCGVLATPELSHGLHEAEVALGWVSKAILIVFTCELLLLLMCLGRHFFTVVYTVDAMVVVTSLILAFTVTGSTNEETALIIFLRCWRFARVLHGFGVTVHEVQELHFADEDKEDGDGDKPRRTVSYISHHKVHLHDLHARQRDELLRYCEKLEKQRDDLIAAASPRTKRH